MPSAPDPSTNAGVYVPPRFQQGPIKTALQLGPLAFLSGQLEGTGLQFRSLAQCVCGIGVPLTEL
jgi:hypothetical protein